VRERADDVLDAAADLRSASQAEWKSSAADTFRARLEDLGRQHDLLHGQVVDAADALDHLADTLESRQHRLGELLEQAGKTWDDARQMVADGVDDVLGTVKGLADKALEDIKDLGSTILGAIT